MRLVTLLRRNLSHYWRTNLAVVGGVAITVGVLTGALLVGDSVRGSLRDLVVQRLGRTTHVITNESFFREQLADDLKHQSAFQSAFSAAVPIIVLEGAVEHEKSSRRAGGVQVYGVDARFWQFHGLASEGDAALAARDALVSPALAREFGAERGDALLLRVQRPSDVPVESLHGRKDQIGRTIRLSTKAVLPAAQLGEFSLRLQQGEVRAVFVPLERLQRDLSQEGRVNTLLVASAADGPTPADTFDTELTAALKREASLEDAGLGVAPLPGQRTVSLTSRHIVIPDAAAEAAGKRAKASGWKEQRLFTYLANTIRIGSHEIPYSLITAADDSLLARFAASLPATAVSGARPPIWLNDWAARDLGAQLGDTVTLEYYVWQEGAGLRTVSAEFELRRTVPVDVLNKDRALAPEFPGIADTESVSDWDPPFPVDLQRVRQRDEEYWDKYRTTPKALLRLEDGQRLWRSRYGQLTALRFVPPDGMDLQKAADEYRNALRAALDPSQVGFATVAVRAQGLEASRGAINFGEYFIYFSLFIVVSAALLAGLFFRLGVEQRLREVGLLRAIGFDEWRIARMFLLEGAALAVLGSALGIAGAIGYGKLLVYGLRTWWVGSVGTTLLELHVSPLTLAAGAAGGVFTALVVVALTLRGLRRATPVNLLAGARKYTASEQPVSRRTSRARWIGIVSGAAGLAILGAASAGAINQVGGFFGAGSLLLTSLLFLGWAWLASEHRALLAGSGAQGLSRLGLRNASWRPGRSLLCIALIASATFLIVAVDSFRRGGGDPLDPCSGTGGYPLLAESLLPIPYDLNTPQGRGSVGAGETPLSQLQFTSFRLRPGDDASCLNLYQPKNPRILGAAAQFIRAGRFSFQAFAAGTPEQQQNPWELLDARFDDGAVPAIADANSMTYVLHRRVGEDFVLEHVRDPQTGQPLRLRLVAALADSMFQSELIISEEQFLRLFAREPSAGGYRVFLIGAAQAQPQPAGETVGALEEALSVYGFDVVSAAERLAAFHRVENTYLSTFQALGGLGLLLGTFGLAAVLLRNVLERRRELALLRAVGFRQRDLVVMIAAENLLLLMLGLVAGTVTALLAIAPALLERGTLPGLSFALLAGVLLAGLLASLLAVAAAVRAPLLEVLRSE
jgi:ABC-type lipoprotein release transport system permease subunit